MSNEPKTVIGYKFAHATVGVTKIDVIVTLEIPLENNFHNMNRPSIVNRQFAKMRCQKAKVLNIEIMTVANLFLIMLHVIVDIIKLLHIKRAKCFSDKF